MAEPAGAAPAGVVAAALLAATAVSMWQAVKARDAQNHAETERDLAKTAQRETAAAETRATAERDAAKTAQRETAAAETRATAEAAIASAVNDFLQVDLLGKVGSVPQIGDEFGGKPDLTVKEALDRASARIARGSRNSPWSRRRSEWLSAMRTSAYTGTSLQSLIWSERSSYGGLTLA